MAPQTSKAYSKLRRPRGRQFGSHVAPGLKRPGGRRDLVRLGEMTGPSRFFAKMIADIVKDLGGARELSRIEAELVRSFAGCATLMQVRNVDIALGETSEIDVSEYAALASTMLRLSSRLGLRQRPRDVTPSLDQFIDNINKNRSNDNGEARDDALADDKL